MIIKNLISYTVRVSQNILGKNSRFYHLGKNVYLFVLKLLKILRVPPRFFEDDLTLIRNILNQSLDFKPTTNGRHIVFLSIRGWRVHLSLEALLAARLRMDGHRITFLSCFDSIPLCTLGSVNHLPETQRNCQSCMNIKKALWEGVFDIEYLSCSQSIKDSIEDKVKQLNLNECQTFEYDGAPYGKLVYRGIIWFLRKSRLSDVDLSTYRKMLVGAHIVRCELEEFLSKNKVDTIVMLRWSGLFGQGTGLYKWEDALG